MKLAAVVSFICMVLAQHASAQNNVVVINNGNRVIANADRPRSVTINFQLSMPAPDVSSSQDMTNAMAATTQSLYEIVNHECEVLTAALKGNCRLSKLNIGGSFNDPNANPGTFGNRGNAVVSANANATFEIEAKAPAAAEPASTPVPPAAPQK